MRVSTSKWPTVSGVYRRKVTIWHAQAWAGNPDQHSHEFVIGFGWTHEINPTQGHTWSVYETEHKVASLCELVAGKNLNQILPNQPTVETLACWLLVRAPAFYDHITIDCYDGYSIRVDRSGIPAAWTAEYLKGASPESLTA